MKAKVKFFSVRHGWIKEGDDVPKSAYSEAVAAGAIKYKTKVSHAKRHDSKQVDRESDKPADLSASDAEAGA